MSETPIPNRKRVVLCRGQFCNESRRADKLYALLQPLLDDINGGDYPPRVRLETATCLSMCGAGPNLIIYPDKIECHWVDEAALRRIVDDHLRAAVSGPGVNVDRECP